MEADRSNSWAKRIEPEREAKYEDVLRIPGIREIGGDEVNILAALICSFTGLNHYNKVRLQHMAHSLVMEQIRVADAEKTCTGRG